MRGQSTTNKLPSNISGLTKHPEISLQAAPALCQLDCRVVLYGLSQLVVPSNLNSRLLAGAASSLGEMILEVAGPTWHFWEISSMLETLEKVSKQVKDRMMLGSSPAARQAGMVKWAVS
jgi:hypothetical protein